MCGVEDLGVMALNEPNAPGFFSFLFLEPHGMCCRGGRMVWCLGCRSVWLQVCMAAGVVVVVCVGEQAVLKYCGVMQWLCVGHSTHHSNCNT